MSWETQYQHCHTGGHEDAEPSICTHDWQGLLTDLWLHTSSSDLCDNSAYAHPHTCHSTADEAWYYWHVHNSFICTMSVHKHTHTFTTHTHQVKEEYVKENDSIGEDEVILEFYPEEQD